MLRRIYKDIVEKNIAGYGSASSSEERSLTTPSQNKQGPQPQKIPQASILVSYAGINSNQKSFMQLLTNPSVWQDKKKQQITHLPPPFDPEFKVVVKRKQRKNSFEIFNKEKQTCLSFEIYTRKKELEIHFILYEIGWADCFKSKIPFPQIIQFFKDVATQLRLDTIKLTDASYIPVRESPDYKLLNLLKNGKTIYMEQGFFYIPLNLINVINFVNKNYPNDIEKKRVLFKNVLIYNQILSKLFVRCSSSIQLSAINGIIIPDGMSGESTLQQLAGWMISVFRKKKDDDPDFENALHNYLTLKNKYLGTAKGKNWKSYLPQLEKENLVQNQLMKPPEIPIGDPKIILSQLWRDESDFETVMYRIEDGEWTQYLSPTQQQRRLV